jgi:uncharacterized protein YcbX
MLWEGPTAEGGAMPAEGRIVGTVAELWRFPVKSMMGERRDALDLRWGGLHGDRQYAFLRAANRSRFPWLTGREVPALLLHRPAYRDPDDPRHAAVEVTLPDGRRLPLDAPELRDALEAAAGEPVSLMQLGRGAFDAMPVSLATQAGLARIEAEHGGAIDRRRFRLNLLIDSTEPEASWQGATLAFGDDPAGPALAIAEGVPRCAMVTLDPDSAARDASVLRTVAQRCGNIAGIYASAARTGWIRVGDAVRVIGAG